MKGESQNLEEILNKHFLKSYPVDAARRLETMSAEDVMPVLSEQPVQVLIPLWSKLVPQFAAELTMQLPEELANEVLTQMAPNDAIRVLAQMSNKQREVCLDRFDSATRDELNRLMSYPEGSAGRLMNPRVPVYRSSMTVDVVLNLLRESGVRVSGSIFVVDNDGRVMAQVLLQDLALAEPSTTLDSLARPIKAVVQAIASSEEVADTFSRYGLLDLPVVDLDGVLLGVIVHGSLVQAVQEETSSDIQAMVGASREERALSSPFFAVKKRMPWLQINLLTAFLAAAVVGVFENTIAQVTALAILLPVVAGQSGNAGAQALAVTMRGLALREITIRHWFTVMFKEVRAGFLNGLCIAVTCGLGVFIWSGSLGLVAVITLSMVIAMVIAGFAGAVVPIMLVRFGQDPAQSSSIILTTVTDIAGFFSFLGIATLLMAFL